jgi:hypothetical protein
MNILIHNILGRETEIFGMKFDMNHFVFMESNILDSNIA